VWSTGCQEQLVVHLLTVTGAEFHCALSLSLSVCREHQYLADG